MVYNSYNPNSDVNFVSLKDRRIVNYQENNPRPSKWNSRTPVTKIFASNANTTVVPEEDRSVVHRDGRHFKLIFEESIKYQEACDFVAKELDFK